MAKSISSAAGRKAPRQSTWKPPYKDFPLSYHPPSGRLYKVIRGKRHYFGYLEKNGGWQAGVEEWNRVKDDLMLGRTPRVKAEGLTVADLCNRFRTSKLRQMESGEITPRTYNDYVEITDRLVAFVGGSRLVVDLAADDFERLKADTAKTCGPVALQNVILRTRMVFRYGYEAGVIDRPVRFGPAFKLSAKVIRLQRVKNGVKMFEADELRRILDAADSQLRAMVLLAINAALGNTDIGALTIANVDLENGWLKFPRPKTGVDRRCPLWTETVEAVRQAIAERPKPKDDANANLVFVTKYGQSWNKRESSANPISAEFRKLLVKLGIHRKGVGFYAIRHTFRTIGDRTRDFPALDVLMGHTAKASDMAARYVERIDDDRLRAVTEHVRAWLFGEPAGAKGGEA